jgi:ATP-binding cassette subfamily C (CFTR/MRP) protein 10
MITVLRWLVYGFYDPRTYLLLIIDAAHILNYIFNIIEWKISRNLNSFQQLQEESGEVQTLSSTADEDENIFSRLFFCWVNPLIKKGYDGQLKTTNDLFPLPPSLKVEQIEQEFVESSPSYYTDASPFSLTKSLFNAFGLQYLALGLLRFAGDCFSFAGPILLHYLVTELEDGDQKSYGYYFATLMLVTSFLSALCDFNFNFYVNKVSLRVRCATVLSLYDKVLQVPICRLSKFSSGQLINFMSTDVDRIVNFFNSFHALWSLIFKLTVALYLLYREVGLAFLSGFAAAILMVPLNLYITFKIGSMSGKMMAFKDQRMRLITETMRAIRTVKMSNWERFFENRIEHIRSKELKYLSRRKYLDAICVYLWASAPVLITIAILSTYTVVMHEKLTAAKVFTSLSLINILIMPLNALPWVLLALVEAYVSIKRFKGFFDLENIDMHGLYGLIEGEGKMLQIDKSTFSWSDSSSHSVKDIAITGTQGSIIGVIGPVGAGKSTLLLGILGETELDTDIDSAESILKEGSIRIPQKCINEGFAYVGHECWLRRGSVKDNILCGSQFQAHLYNSVIRATALEYDIEKMPNKDEYLIGDDGTTLSGGQRARLALARALYQDSDVYLLDDPFSSLDVKVGKFVWENCVEKLLKQRGKLVIIATHHTEYLTKADELICLNAEGKIIKSGSPSEVLKSAEVTPFLTLPADDVSISEHPILFDSVEPIAEAEEESRAGTVRLGVYWSYLRATGYILSIAIATTIIFMQVSKNLSDAWLSKWTVNSTTEGTDNLTLDETGICFKDMSYPLGERQSLPIKDEEWNKTKYFLLVYVCLAAVNTFITLIRAFLFAYGGIVSARRLHQRLLKVVLNSKLAWWDETPWGRVVNRLCSDIYTIDDSLPFQLNICLASLVNLIGALILTSVALPFLIPFIILLFIVYYFIQRYYRYTTCEVKRLTSLSLSPLYSHITDTVTGIVTIRAHRFVERFSLILNERLGANIRAQFSSLAASQWLSVRLQLLGVVMISLIAFMSVFEIRLHYVETGLVGLAITYALSMNNLLNSLLCSFIDTEKELVAVERVSDYIQDVPLEDTNVQQEDVDKFLYCRNIKGQINFASVSLRYGPSLPWALKNITFTIDPGQRVAIIGRTGAGKSSIFQALLRAHPIETGKIFIDSTIDLGKLELKAVRSIFGIVTQSPFIFSGTVRENFCVNYAVSDAEILDIVSKAGLRKWLNRVGGLDAEIAEGGANFSFGEKQIICLCRLILSKPKIVLIDEATAHLDEKTHIILNTLLRQTLPTTTVISIMHRLSGLQMFDTIIEMVDGVIHRRGPPDMFTNIPSRGSSSASSRTTSRSLN